MCLLVALRALSKAICPRTSSLDGTKAAYGIVGERHPLAAGRKFEEYWDKHGLGVNRKFEAYWDSLVRLSESDQQMLPCPGARCCSASQVDADFNYCWRRQIGPFRVETFGGYSDPHGFGCSGTGTISLGGWTFALDEHDFVQVRSDPRSGTFVFVMGLLDRGPSTFMTVGIQPFTRSERTTSPRDPTLRPICLALIAIVIAAFCVRRATRLSLIVPTVASVKSIPFRETVATPVEDGVVSATLRASRDYAAGATVAAVITIATLLIAVPTAMSP
jgi:hypothetical protein